MTSLKTIVATLETAIVDVRRGFYEQVWSRQQRKERVCIRCKKNIRAGELFYRWYNLSHAPSVVKHVWVMCDVCFKHVKES